MLRYGNNLAKILSSMITITMYTAKILIHMLVSERGSWWKESSKFYEAEWKVSSVARCRLLITEIRLSSRSEEGGSEVTQRKNSGRTA